MDLRFLRAVQGAGWQILSVDQASVTARCRCGQFIRLPTLEIVTPWAQALSYDLAVCPLSDPRLILRPDPARRMGIAEVFALARAAALTILTRPVPLPDQTLRLIAETRDRLPSRTRRFQQEDRRRARLQQSGGG